MTLRQDCVKGGKRKSWSVKSLEKREQTARGGRRISGQMLRRFTRRTQGQRQQGRRRRRRRVMELEARDRQREWSRERVQGYLNVTSIYAHKGHRATCIKVKVQGLQNIDANATMSNRKPTAVKYPQSLRHIPRPAMPSIHWALSFCSRDHPRNTRSRRLSIPHHAHTSYYSSYPSLSLSLLELVHTCISCHI